MEIRENIIKEATLLYIKQGIKPITMDILANKMGISKRTIYENFKDKDDLLINCLKWGIESHKQKAIKIINESKNVIEALYNFGKYNREEFGKIHNRFFEDLQKYHKNVEDQLKLGGRLHNTEIIYLILKKGVNEGIFDKTINLELANYIIHKIFDLFKEVRISKEFSNRDIWNSGFLAYLKGISTEKGRTLIDKTFISYENCN